jgi:hypothetical protein
VLVGCLFGLVVVIVLLTLSLAMPVGGAALGQAIAGKVGAGIGGLCGLFCGWWCAYFARRYGTDACEGDSCAFAFMWWVVVIAAISALGKNAEKRKQAGATEPPPSSTFPCDRVSWRLIAGASPVQKLGEPT